MNQTETKRYDLPEETQPAMVAEEIATQYAADLRYGMEILNNVSPEDLHHIVVYLSGYTLKKDDVSERFNALFDKWWAETCIYSGPNLCYENENFKAIKQMGCSVIPFIEEKSISAPQYMQRHIQWLRKGVES